ncbi:MAG: TRAP transporter small permease [Spirochaeta sp.]|jgi:TRAP-type C4-dicarboxylate transport system permease small subunit|nr:TRAP transporter small permease [Spirochaeta sp.]
MKSITDSAVTRGIARVQQGIVLILLMVIPVLVVIQVLLRYVLQMPLMGIEEIMLFPTIWLYMLGGGVASYERDHIQAGIVALYIKNERRLAIFYFIRTVVSFIISIWLTYWAFKYFLYSMSVWKLSNLLYLPLFAGESAMFIGLLSMTFFTFVELIDRYNTIGRPTQSQT